MEDEELIQMFWDRDERAIRETDLVYGRKLQSLADRITDSYEDAQECVSDTYYKTWTVIPPQRPNYLYAFLAKICRNICLNRIAWSDAVKRKADVVSLSSELEACIPDARSQEQLSARELGQLLSGFLDSISRESRMIFLRRYWYGDEVKEIAQRYSISESKVKTRLHRTRAKLHQFLSREGITV